MVSGAGALILVSSLGKLKVEDFFCEITFGENSASMFNDRPVHMVIGHLSFARVENNGNKADLN